MNIEMTAVNAATSDQRNAAQDQLAFMTAYTKALEARLAELEKPDDEPVGRHRKT